jgi:8-oxo-dGTP pyrophosphatase MutT (NUDIX family)
MQLPAEIERLHRALQGPLSGHTSRELSAYPRPKVENARKLDPPPRESAVLLLIYPRDEKLYTLLMVRPIYDGVHSGQVAFPGGRREPQDLTLEHTALREFSEETGSSIHEVIMLGRLSEIYIPPSRSIVTPFIGYAPMLGELDPDPAEVAALIETPLDELLRPEILKRRMQYVQMLGGEIDVPYYDVLGHVVWGATAMMIAELRELFNRLRNTDLDK